jgi:hypothetical protein
MNTHTLSEKLASAVSSGMFFARGFCVKKHETTETNSVTPCCFVFSECFQMLTTEKQENSFFRGWKVFLGGYFVVFSLFGT